MSRLPSHLETERLILRQPETADAEALNAAIHASHPELKVWMDWAVEPQTLEETRAYIRTSAEAMDAETAANLLMVDRTSGEIVGSSGYPRLDWSVPSFEIGYWCRSDRVGRGLVSEATRALADHAFTKLGAVRVELRMDDANDRSWRVAERLGFTLEGVLRNDSRTPDKSLRDTRVYSALCLADLTDPL
jgi:RimJ/RimL family protein N-acetyltransferase